MSCVSAGGHSGARSDRSSQIDHVVVPDVQLLFAADFCRAGSDLVLIGQDGRHHIIPGYFATENRAALMAPNGASLSPDVVDLLAEPASRYAQAQPTTPPDPVGRVENVVGDVTVVRNRITVALNVGDAVFKTDVIETGVDGLAVIVFVDGTVFHLYASGHMEVDEFICGAEKSANSALFRVAKGMFGFIAGKIATSGRLIVDTPLAQVQSTAPAAGFGSLAFSIFTFALIHELQAASVDLALLDDGTIDYKDRKHGVFEIITKEARPRHIIVDDPGKTYVFQPNGSGTLSVEQVTNSPIVMAQYESAYHSTQDSLSRAQQDPFIQHFLEQRAETQPPTNPGNTTNPFNAANATSFRS